MKKAFGQTEKKAEINFGTQVVGVGRVQDVTGGTRSDAFADGFKISLNRKNKYGGAGERG